MSLEIGFIGLGILVVLLALRMPIGLSLILVSFGGLAAARGPNAAMSAIATVPFDFMAHWTMTALPMFLLMGALASNSGMMGLLYKAVRLWMGRMPGGLSMATTVAGAGFSALSGSSLATTASLGRIAVPEMLKVGYDKGLATGTAAAVGTIGALIPPSIIMVLYASFAGESVGKMLVAGVVPGLLTAFGYIVFVYIRCRINPALGPAADIGEVTLLDKIKVLGPIWPVPVVGVGIVLAIYGGWATATEAAAIGVMMVLGVVAIQGRLTWGVLYSSLRDTASTTASILMIAVGATLLTQFLAFTGVTFYLAEALAGLTTDPLMIVVIACLIYLILGSFLDGLGLLLLTLPVLLPIFNDLGVDGIWAGVILVKMVEIAMLTPPIGMNVFVVKSAVGSTVPLGTIFRGVTWFLVPEFFIMAALLLYPPLITWLPSLMYQ